jgi:hypothetical protein
LAANLVKTNVVHFTRFAVELGGVHTRTLLRCAGEKTPQIQFTSNFDPIQTRPTETL